MPNHFDQIKKMREKADRLRARARRSDNPRIADKYLRQADIISTSIEAIKQNWREFALEAKGNQNFQGKRHSQESREKMSRARKDFWESNAGREKMWRARRRRKYREKGWCQFRFPRVASSVDKEWLKDYRERYRRVIGKRPEVRLY